MKKKFALILLVLLTLTIVLGACSSTGKGDSSKITIGIAQDLEDSLDPHRAVAAGTKEVLFNVYEGLMKPAPDGSVIPAVAEKFEVSQDGKEYTFTLREGVKFHNGDPVKASDVKYSIEKIAGMMGDKPRISAFSLIEAVNIEDEKTIVIKLSEPNMELPYHLAMTNAAIIPESNKTPDTVAIGTGPYKFVSRSPQENIVMESFDDYWGDKPFIKDVIFKIEANADTLVMDLMGGSLDMFKHMTKTQVDQLDDNFRIYEGTANLVQALYLNNKEKPFDDIRVRQAMCYATDKEGVIKLAFDGKGVPIGSAVIPAFKKYYMPELNDVYTYDVEKAKELLKEAGYENGFNMTITVPSNYDPHVKTAEVLVEQYKKVGINAKLELVEWNSWLSDVYGDRKHQSTIVGTDPSSMTARAMLERYVSDSGKNFVNFSDERYDEIFKKAISTVDDEESTICYKQLETILTEKAASVYIQDMAEFVALNKKFDGYTFYPMYIIDVSKIKPAS
ncbi:MAG: ABC transporter substrate-binding protein [Lachnospiraceae bacterium]|nr:ABC transporter substrate-binding protein [Lachnospiraceae bacterium]